MIKDAPSIVSKKKRDIAKASKQVLNDIILSNARQMVETADGKIITKWEAVVARQYDIAMFAESNADATSSAKWLADRVLGKPAVMSEKETKPTPKVIFQLDSDDQSEILRKAALADEEDDYDDEQDEECIGVTTDTGEQFLV